MEELISAEELSAKPWEEILAFGDELLKQMKERDERIKRVKKKVEIIKLLLNEYKEGKGSDFITSDLFKQMTELIAMLEAKLFAKLPSQEYRVFLEAIKRKLGKSPLAEIEKFKKED